MNTQKTHYIAMSGNHGYLPDYCAVYQTENDAIADLAEMFGLGRTRIAELRRTGSVELVPNPISGEESFGAEYCEVTECKCGNPQSHSDEPLDWN